jgi:hypothetical protein
MKKKIKAVYFSDCPEDLRVLQWVEGKGNFSRYVRELIQADMRGELDPRIVAKIDKLLEQKLAGKVPGGKELEPDYLKGMLI